MIFETQLQKKRGKILKICGVDGFVNDDVTIGRLFKKKRKKTNKNCDKNT